MPKARRVVESYDDEAEGDGSGAAAAGGDGDDGGGSGSRSRMYGGDEKSAVTKL